MVEVFPIPRLDRHLHHSRLNCTWRFYGFTVSTSFVSVDLCLGVNVVELRSHLHNSVEFRQVQLI